MLNLIHRDKEHFALLYRTDRANNRLAIFVHGFRGNYWSTWGGLPALLQHEAEGRAVFEDWDYLFLGYNTSDVATYLDIAECIWTEWRRASSGDPPYKRTYTRLALLGHSLGTLGIRQALCAHQRRPANMLQALHRVMYFGSPINGSTLAHIAAFWKIADALKPSSPQLRMLKLWTEDGYSHQQWPKVRVITGIDDKVVGYANAEIINWAGDEAVYQTAFDHSDLVKPRGWNTNVVDFVEACLR